MTGDFQIDGTKSGCALQTASAIEGSRHLITQQQKSCNKTLASLERMTDSSKDTRSL